MAFRSFQTKINPKITCSKLTIGCRDLLRIGMSLAKLVAFKKAFFHDKRSSKAMKLSDLITGA